MVVNEQDGGAGVGESPDRGEGGEHLSGVVLLFDRGKAGECIEHNHAVGSALNEGSRVLEEPDPLGEGRPGVEWSDQDVYVVTDPQITASAGPETRGFFADEQDVGGGNGLAGHLAAGAQGFQEVGEDSGLAALGEAQEGGDVPGGQEASPVPIDLRLLGELGDRLRVWILSCSPLP